MISISDSQRMLYWCLRRKQATVVQDITLCAACCACAVERMPQAGGTERERERSPCCMGAHFDSVLVVLQEVHPIFLFRGSLRGVNRSSCYPISAAWPCTTPLPFDTRPRKGERGRHRLTRKHATTNSTCLRKQAKGKRKERYTSEGLEDRGENPQKTPQPISALAWVRHLQVN